MYHGYELEINDNINRTDHFGVIYYGYERILYVTDYSQSPNDIYTEMTGIIDFLAALLEIPHDIYHERV